MYRYIVNISMALCFVASMALSACYDDKGNYDYSELDEIVIDTVGLGIQATYVVNRYDKLSIAPKIKYNGKDVSNDSSAPLDYVWTLYNAHSGMGITYVVDTLGYSSKLENVEITPIADSYTIQLTVTDLNSGIESYFKVACQVEESITAGWMLLYECADEPDKSDVGLVVNPLVKKNIIQEREFWNLYKSSNGTSLEGKPIQIMHAVEAGMATASDLVSCLTDKEYVRVNNATFVKVEDLKDRFYAAPSSTSALWTGAALSPSNRKGYILVDGEVYTINYMLIAGGGYYFGMPKSGEHGELASWGSCSASYDAVVYDQTNEKFLCVNSSSVELSSFTAQSPTAAFDVNNVGMELLMADWGRGSTPYSTAYDYMLMKKENERYLAIANFSTNQADTNIGLGLYNVSSSPDIDNATTMATAYLGEYVLYGAGSKVYNLSYNASTVAKEWWTAPSSDEEVTCVRMQKFHYLMFLNPMMGGGIMPNANAIVHITTWNKNTKEGKLYQYPINPASGTITGEPKIYTVPGKVKDMAWKYVMDM